MHGERGTPTVALTFDDGPNPFFTEKFLEILKTAGCSASFFLIGRFAESYPDLVRKIFADGHTIGGHTYSHGGDDDQQTYADFCKGNETLAQITGQPVKYLRVPGFGYSLPDNGGCRASELFGVLSAKIITRELMVVDQDGVILNDWDYNRVTPESIHVQVLQKCRNGSVIDLHDGSHKSHEMSFRPGKTLEALPRIIQDLRTRGFQMVNLDSLSLEFQEIVVIV
jgi:peptidoglycan/xylan/chitin deacetylase (PgdA/CDA1 family)